MTKSDYESLLSLNTIGKSRTNINAYKRFYIWYYMYTVNNLKITEISSIVNKCSKSIYNGITRLSHLSTKDPIYNTIRNIKGIPYVDIVPVNFEVKNTYTHRAKTFISKANTLEIINVITMADPDRVLSRKFKEKLAIKLKELINNTYESTDNK